MGWIVESRVGEMTETAVAIAEVTRNRKRISVGLGESKQTELLFSFSYAQ